MLLSDHSLVMLATEKNTGRLQHLHPLDILPFYHGALHIEHTTLSIIYLL
jgi:hypothetical protein